MTGSRANGGGLVTRRVEIEPFITKDGSSIRELIHPAVHGTGKQSVAEAMLPAGQKTLLHRHRLSEEIYHILEGNGWVRLGDRCHPVTVGDTIRIPPGTPHGMVASEGGALVFLCCCVPPYRHEDTELLEE